MHLRFSSFRGWIRFVFITELHSWRAFHQQDGTELPYQNRYSRLQLYVHSSIEKESISIPSKFSNQSQLLILSDSQKLERTVCAHGELAGTGPMTKCTPTRAFYAVTRMNMCWEPALAVCISKNPHHTTCSTSFIRFCSRGITKTWKINVCHFTDISFPFFRNRSWIAIHRTTLSIVFAFDLTLFIFSRDWLSPIACCNKFDISEYRYIGLHCNHWKQNWIAKIERLAKVSGE